MPLLSQAAKTPSILGWKRVGKSKYQRGQQLLERRADDAWYLRNGSDVEVHTFPTLRLALIWCHFGGGQASDETFAPARQEVRGPFMLGCGECEFCERGEDCPRCGDPISDLEDDGLDNRF